MRRWHCFLAAALLTAPVVVQAQTTQVSNLGSAGDAPVFFGGSVWRDRVAQSFTTGGKQRATT